MAESNEILGDLMRQRDEALSELTAGKNAAQAEQAQQIDQTVEENIEEGVTQEISENPNEEKEQEASEEEEYDYGMGM